MKPFGATTASKPNFYYIVYDMQTFTLSIIISYHIVVGLFVMLGQAASCHTGPKCSGLGSWDRSNCNTPWSSLCTNYAQFARAFNHMPMIGEAAMGKLWQADVIKTTKEMCSLFRQNKQRGVTKDTPYTNSRK